MSLEEIKEQYCLEKFGHHYDNAVYRGLVGEHQHDEIAERYAQQRVNEVLDAEKVDIDFDGNVLARFTIQDGKLKITDAMNGYGEAIDVSKIKINEVES